MASNPRSSIPISPIIPVSAPSQPVAASFPPMYYNSPVTQMVLGIDISADDSLTAAITAGAPYFAVSAIDVCNWINVPIGQPAPGNPVVGISDLRPPLMKRQLSPPVATSDGVKPLSVTKGQYARLWVTALVNKGAALSPGTFTGTAKLTGASVTNTLPLQGSYRGSLIGKVTVLPETVAPGQPVLVQVLDSGGKPVADPNVTVTIQGVESSSRYYQFPTVGDRTLIVNALCGTLSETTQASVVVAGTPLAFRSSLTTPAVTAVPMLQVAAVEGQSYIATFNLGPTPGVRRVLAASTGDATKTAALSATPSGAAIVAPADAMGAELSKALASLPADKVISIAPISTKTDSGVATASAVLASVGGLRTPATGTSYQWDFGDGQTLTTQSPTATHDYFPAIQAGKVAHSFDVTCTVVHDNVTVKRTLVLHSAYGLCRQLGVVVPPLTGTAYATFQQVAFSASLIVHNLEPYPIQLSAMACVPVSDDTTVLPPPPSFIAMQNSVTVAAESASALGIYIPLSRLQLGTAKVNGFIVYYQGTMHTSDGTSVPVRFSYMFRIPLSDSGLPAVRLPVQYGASVWDMGSALQAVSTLVTQPNAAVSKPGNQVVDPATNTVAIALSANPHDLTTLMQVGSAIQAGMTNIALKTGALDARGTSLTLVSPLKASLTSTTPKAGSVTATGIRARVSAPRLPSPVLPRSPSPVLLDLKFDPLSPPTVQAGNECYPDDISDADAATAAAQQLVCQLTTETINETIPSSFQNAQAGDVILSPAPVGGGDLIATMFSALVPPQHHGHSGIMTANFFEITHCTASVDRIKDNLNKDALGIPTSLNANMLQYGWPGSLTQSIDDATTQVFLKDPGGTSYPLSSFNTTSEGDGFEIIPPLVVKPLPENEATVRPQLRKAADMARSKGAKYDASGNLVQKGGCYYSFYAYTDPQLSAGFTDAAGADAGWAEGMSPAVCSSFVWMNLKAQNTPLVTTNQYEKLSDFSASATAGGAQVGAATLDGLVFYPAAERLQAGQALYQMFMNQALGQEYGLGTIPGINGAIAGPIADQLLNAFANGNTNLPGSDAWQNPGDGNAVSPDNIIWWNPPYFGYAEPLQYLPSHSELYTVSKWAKVITWGSVKGTVRSNGAPVPNAHVWVYLPGGDTYTGADGSYTLNHIPIGAYQIKAQAVIPINGVSEEMTNGNSGQAITLSTANSNITQDINLQGLPVYYRRADVTYSISCDHGDDNPFNTHGVQSAGPFSQSTYVNPGQVTNSLSYSYDYNGGGYFHIDYTFTTALLEDLSLEVTVTGVMYDDGSNNVQDQYTVGPFNVPLGTTWSGWMDMENSGTGYHNGNAHFTFSVANNQQTG